LTSSDLKAWVVGSLWRRLVSAAVVVGAGRRFWRGSKTGREGKWMPEVCCLSENARVCGSTALTDATYKLQGVTG
jgi:hypothetical protein